MSEPARRIRRTPMTSHIVSTERLSSDSDGV